MNTDKNLNFSTSVPIFSSTQLRATQSYLKYPTTTLESNSYRVNSANVEDRSFQMKKGDTSLPFSLPLKFNQALENQKYGVAQSQIQNQSNQAYRFQFKRSSINSARPQLKQNIPSDQIGQQRSSAGYQLASSNLYSQYGSASVNQNIGASNFLQKENAEKNDIRIQEYEKKIKELENQLKFEQKYANDLYRTSEDIKKEISTVKDENKKLEGQIVELKAKNDELTRNLTEYKQLHTHQVEINEELKTNINQKNGRIQFLQNIESSNALEIQKLSQKITNFSSYYRNELYEERIKQLNEELINTNSLLTQSVIEKNQLIEQIKIKNQKILYLTIDSPTKGKQPLMKSINVSQKANQAINIAFEESIKLYQKDIKDLKQIIEKQNEDYRKLREELIEQKKDIEGLKQEGRVTALKTNAEKNQILQEKDRKLTEKTNQIKTLMHRFNMLEQKYSKALKEIKEKDSFLQEHLVGRAKDLELKEYIERIMQEYVQSFQSRFSLELKVKQLEKQLNEHKNQ